MCWGQQICAFLISSTVKPAFYGTAKHRFFFRCREVSFQTCIWSSDPRECKSFSLKTGLCYAHDVPPKTGFTVLRSVLSYFLQTPRGTYCPNVIQLPCPLLCFHTVVIVHFPPYNPVIFLIIVIIIIIVVFIIFLFSFSGWQHSNHCSSDDNKKTSNRDELLCDVTGCCWLAGWDFCNASCSCSTNYG
jgi:hypothetical protein